MSNEGIQQAPVQQAVSVSQETSNNNSQQSNQGIQQNTSVQQEQNQVAQSTNGEQQVNTESQQTTGGDQQTTQEVTRPKTIEEAVGMLSRKESDTAQANVSDTEQQQSDEQVDNTGDQQAVQDQSNGQQEQTINDQESGDNAGQPEVFNEQNYLNQKHNELINYSKDVVNKLLQENNKKTSYVVDDLLDQEALKEGRRIFINPDNNQELDRYQAEQWVETINKQIQNDINNAMKQVYDNKLKEITPALKTEMFLMGKYNTLAEDVKQELDELTKPYAVLNNKGQVCAFDCDFDQLVNQAETNIKLRKYEEMTKKNTEGGNVLENQEQNVPVETPALDAQTSSNVVSDPSKIKKEDIKDLASALRFLDENPDEQNKRRMIV